jgi:hypothetical protein
MSTAQRVSRGFHRLGLFLASAIFLLGSYRWWLGRVLINRQPNADLDVPPNVRYWGYVARLVSMSAKDPKRTLAFQNNILF